MRILRKQRTPRALRAVASALAPAVLLVAALLLHTELAAQNPQGTSARIGGDTGQKSAARAVSPAAVASHAAIPSEAPDSATDDPASAALAPVVYNDDETPGTKGYQYTFFGNAFFINEDGYLLTVAHVLESFSGGQAYILLSRANAPPQLVKVAVVAKDVQHDVAILRATPNPFTINYSVAVVALSATQPTQGETVLALSVHPKRVQNAHTFELQREDFSPGTVIAFESTQLAKAGLPSDVFLLSHPVVKGQSGSPVLDAATHSAVGLIEGIWLRGTSASIRKTAMPDASVPGAAIPVRYALALLKENNVAWHSAPTQSSPASAASASSSSSPH